MRRIILMMFGFGTLALVSCATPRRLSVRPTLEVSQVPPYRWEVIVRLRDESATGNSVRCSIYRVLENGTNWTEGRLADIRMARTVESGLFIGIYSNGIDPLTHGKKTPEGFE